VSATCKTNSKIGKLAETLGVGAVAHPSCRLKGTGVESFACHPSMHVPHRSVTVPEGVWRARTTLVVTAALQCGTGLLWATTVLLGDSDSGCHNQASVYTRRPHACCAYSVLDHDPHSIGAHSGCIWSKSTSDLQAPVHLTHVLPHMAVLRTCCVTCRHIPQG
jgi:hypothetical protein